jgi:hypothetical protein
VVRSSQFAVRSSRFVIRGSACRAVAAASQREGGRSALRRSGFGAR